MYLGSLPAAAQRLIELDHADQFVQPDLRESELRLEQVAIRVEGIQLSVNAAAITNIGQPRSVLKRSHQRFLLHAALSQSLMRDQRARHFCERTFNPFCVLYHSDL